MDGTIIALVCAVIVIGGLLLVLIRYMPYPAGIDKEKYQSRWLEIERKAKSGNPDGWHMAILNADKLLDQALKETGSRGKTMGERMKDRQSAWSHPNVVWSAHKLRNSIAHDEQVEVSEKTVSRALAGFKQALMDLGVM